MSREVSKNEKVAPSMMWDAQQLAAYQKGFKAAQAGTPLSDAPTSADRQFWQAGFLQYEKVTLTKKLW